MKYCCSNSSYLRVLIPCLLVVLCFTGNESEDNMSTLAGRRGMRPKMMMPFDTQPPQRK